MGRRRFVDTLLTLGVSSSTAAALTKDELAKLTDDPSQQVPRTKYFRHTNHDEVVNGGRPNRGPTFYTVPRDQWIETETAVNAATSLGDRLGLPGVEVGVTNQIQKAPGISVDYKPPSESGDTGHKVELDANTDQGDSGDLYFEIRESSVELNTEEPT